MSEYDVGTKNLVLTREGPILWCRIDRPNARNALTPSMYFGIKRAVRLVNTDPDLRALIITGTGDVFAPGGDLGGRYEEGDERPPQGLTYETLPFVAIRESIAPVVAAVNGICLAGGLLIAMMADVAVVSERATFRVPEILRGLIDATYAATLPAHVGLAVARDLILTARKFDAAEAQRIGLVSRVVPHEELRERALQAARELLQGAPEARAHTKRMLNQAYAPIDYETMFAALMSGGEAREGMMAFMEKRDPNWIPKDLP
jgi:enoyl-CoA hydratase/carnithine racemase